MPPRFSECREVRRWEELHGTILPGVMAARELYFDFDLNPHNLKITKLRRKKSGTSGAYAHHIPSTERSFADLLDTVPGKWN